jgi:multidrug efflux pump
MMTTCAAIAGALPLAVAFGDGTEVRRPLGIAVVGGLVVSQLLTVYTTPVVYLAIRRASDWFGRKFRRKRRAPAGPAPGVDPAPGVGPARDIGSVGAGAP